MLVRRTLAQSGVFVPPTTRLGKVSMTGVSGRSPPAKNVTYSAQRPGRQEPRERKQTRACWTRTERQHLGPETSVDPPTAYNLYAQIFRGGRSTVPVKPASNHPTASSLRHQVWAPLSVARLLGRTEGASKLCVHKQRGSGTCTAKIARESII